MSAAAVRCVAVVLAATATLGGMRPVASQQFQKPVDPFFLERSMIFNRAPRDDLAFEAQIAPHLFVKRPDYWGDGDVFTRPVTSWAVSLTPLVRLRMFSTHSFPVRTPSFMPRPLGDWQVFRTSATDTAASAREFWETPLRMWGVTFTPWAHHSNGQEGCLYTYQGDAPDCDDPRLSGAALETNKVDGSFSTNFLRLGVGYTWFAPPHLTDDYAFVGSRCSYQLDVEWHPMGYLLGGIEAEQAAYYPRVQATASFEWGGLDGRLLMGGSARWLDHPAPGVSDMAYTVEATLLPRRFSGWGFFTRFYSGMDYYNLGFLEDISYLEVGLAWDASNAPQVTLGSTPTTTAASPYEQSALLDRILPGPLDALCRALH